MNIDKFNILPESVNVDAQRKNVVYIGVDGSSGYACAAKGYIYELSKTHNVRFIAYINTPVVPDDSDFEKSIDQTKTTHFQRADEIILHYIPTDWDYFLSNLKIPYDSHTKIIGRTVWEFEKVPKLWVDTINSSKVTHVSVPTHWNKEVFIANGVTKSITVDPHIYVDTPFKQTRLKDIIDDVDKTDIIFNTQLDDLDSYYKFYNISQWHPRKGIEESIIAYRDAFKSTDKVIFILKLNIHKYTDDEKKWCSDKIREICKGYDHAPIVYIKGRLASDEIKSLHAQCDGYFSLTKTEGVGLGILEAFHLNKDIIVPKYSGYLEFLDAYPTKYVTHKLTPVPASFKPLSDVVFDESYKWAESDIASAIEVLRQTAHTTRKYTPQNISVSILDQSKHIEICDLPYTNTDFYFNSSIVNVKGNNYIFARHCKITGAKKRNRIALFFADTYEEIPLPIKDEVEQEQYEDPRVMVDSGYIYIGCANYTRGSKHIHQKLLVLDTDFNHIDNIHISYDGNMESCVSNTKHQKNWTYFMHDGRLMCVYKMYPHTVLEINKHTGAVKNEYISHIDIQKKWKWGDPRNGTNPVYKDGQYHSFFHSSLPWRDPKRQYFMGGYRFNPTPPFDITYIDSNPILWGNESDPRVLEHESPVVIFPCGMIIKDNRFVVSFGLNDEKTGIITI
jgi:predicted GH43/DUF377 family glycosyl hydrolase/glycosyltransferase involved in cell wall biosynthesis